jgi:hypothetical protein
MAKIMGGGGGNFPHRSVHRDKSRLWNRWCRKAIPEAAELYGTYLKEARKTINNEHQRSGGATTSQLPSSPPAGQGAFDTAVGKMLDQNRNHRATVEHRRRALLLRP